MDHRQNPLACLAVTDDHPLIVAKDGHLLGLADDIVGHDGDFPGAFGTIHDEGRYGKTGRVSPQILHDLNPFADTGSEVFDTFNLVALEQVVGPDLDLHKLAAKSLDRLGVVVDPAQKNRLIVDANTVSQKPVDRSRRFRSDFLWMIELSIDPDWPVGIEHRAKLFIDAHRDGHRSSGANADHFHVRDCPQSFEDRLEAGGIHRERIAAGQDNIADLGGSANVVDHRLDIGGVDSGVSSVPDSFAGAVSAEHRAGIGYDHQGAIFISVGESGDRHVVFFGERVGSAEVSHFQFSRVGKRLPQDWVVAVARIGQGKVIRGDNHAETLFHGGHLVNILGGAAKVFFEGSRFYEAAFHLPMPILPFFAGAVQGFGKASPASKLILFFHGSFRATGGPGFPLALAGLRGVALGFRPFAVSRHEGYDCQQTIT